jgi:hypothetical protein
MMNEKKTLKMAGIKAALDGGNLNAKAANKAKRSLARLAYDYPEEAASLGVVTDHSITLVYQYGVLLSDCSFPSENLECPDPANPRTVMRLRIAYYNALVEAAKPLLEERRLLLSGPRQADLSAVNREISAKYAQIRQINQQNRRRVKSEEVQALLVAIANLKKSREPLWEPARKELFENRKERKAELADIENRLFKQRMKHMRDVFGPKGKGLWHGNYVKIEEEFRQAWSKVCQSPTFDLHYRYERRDGSRPNDPVSWEGWDGEGAITVSNSQRKISKDLASIVSGRHPRIRIGRLDRLTWQEMGGDPRYFERDTSRLYVCKLRIGSRGKNNTEPIWARAVFVMHRPLPADASVVRASLLRKQVGLKPVEALSICVTTEARPQRTSGRRVTFTLGQFPIVATWVDDAGEYGSLRLPSDFLVSMQKLPTLQALLAAYENATIAQIDTLGNQCRPEFEQELHLHTSTRNGLKRYYEYWSLKCKLDAELCARWKAQVRLQLEQHKSHNREVIANGVNEAVLLIAPSIQEHSKLDNNKSMFLAALLVFHERYKHLNLLITAVRERKLRQRRDTYRKFANQFPDAMTFVLPKVDLRSRRASKTKILVSPSELIEVLEHFAQREGIRVEWMETKKAKDSEGEYPGHSSNSKSSSER